MSIQQREEVSLEDISSWEKKEVNIFCLGTSRTGKSLLMENVLYIKGESPDHIKELIQTHGINIKDDIGEKPKKKSKEHGNVDILVYCIPVDPSSRFDNEQPGFMKTLQKALGENIWKHCIIVFTFSNQVLDRTRKKIRDSKGATVMYIDHIKEYAIQLEDQLKIMKVKNVSVKTVFDLPLEAQPADHTTIMAIPAGDEPEDQVLSGVQYEHLKVTIQGSDKPIELLLDTSDWRELLFIEIVKKCKSEDQETLMRYRYSKKLPQQSRVASIVGVSGGLHTGLINNNPTVTVL